eukprot:8440379-Lingulodinium_polyedra.AAC.1
MPGGHISMFNEKKCDAAVVVRRRWRELITGRASTPEALLVAVKGRGSASSAVRPICFAAARLPN